MTLRARLARLEASHAEEWIEAPLDPEVKLFALAHHLLLDGEAGALAYARKLHLQRERRPRVEPPTPPEVEAQLRRLEQDCAARAAAMDPAERAALDRVHAAREARAREILAQAALALAQEQAEGAGPP
jgi:hypothetical protein